MAEKIFFFSSHGDLWVTCEVNETGACAFGPTGIAREAQPFEAGLELGPEENAYTAASRAGRLVRAEEEGDWDTLS